MVYHVRSYTEIVGDPLYNPNRHTCAKEFTWNLDGTPNFGFPNKKLTNDKVHISFLI
ncbi:hypothetical protein [Neobacillus niacini]|uniref:hypothetical protein n=1 Tax=Neobacillus niacini TaxID=86668 RepID=UPI001C3F2D33